MMAYPVLNDFIEKNHNNAFYKKGEEYPKANFKADSKRVAFLQKKHRKYKVAFLGPEIKAAAPHRATAASAGGKNGAK